MLAQIMCQNGAVPTLDSYEELLGYGGAQPVVLGNDFTDKLMQPALKDPGHAAVLKPGADAPGLSLGRPLPAVDAGNCIEIAHDRLVAGGERARHFVFQDQEIGDQPWFEAITINPMIGCKRRDRAQDRRPLEIVERTTDTVFFGQQKMVFHIENARGVVGTLNIAAEP